MLVEALDWQLQRFILLFTHWTGITQATQTSLSLPLALIKKFKTLKYILRVAKGSRKEHPVPQLAAETQFMAALITHRLTSYGSPRPPCSHLSSGSGGDPAVRLFSTAFVSVWVHRWAPRRGRSLLGSDQAHCKPLATDEAGAIFLSWGEAIAFLPRLDRHQAPRMQWGRGGGMWPPKAPSEAPCCPDHCSLSLPHCSGRFQGVSRG